MRRVIALGVGVLILILLLLGVRGCLNARKERGFENYVSDLGGIVTQSNQLSQDFFGRLEDPPKGLTELQLEAEITTDRGTAESLLQRAEGLDVPDELADAQDELVQAFELRRDGLAGIAEDIPTALGNEGRDRCDRPDLDRDGGLPRQRRALRARAGGDPGRCSPSRRSARRSTRAASCPNRWSAGSTAPS